MRCKVAQGYYDCLLPEMDKGSFLDTLGRNDVVQLKEDEERWERRVTEPDIRQRSKVRARFCLLHVLPETRCIETVETVRRAVSRRVPSSMALLTLKGTLEQAAKEAFLQETQLRLVHGAEPASTETFLLEALQKEQEMIGRIQMVLDAYLRVEIEGLHHAHALGETFFRFHFDGRNTTRQLAETFRLLLSVGGR